MYELEDVTKYPNLTDYEEPLVDNADSRYPSWYKQLTDTGLFEAGIDTEHTTYRVIGNTTLVSFSDKAMWCSIDMRPGPLRGWGGRICKLNDWYLYGINDGQLMVIHNITDPKVQGSYNSDYVLTIYSTTLDILYRFCFTGDYIMHKEGIAIRRPRFFGEPDHPEEEIIVFKKEPHKPLGLENFNERAA